MITVYEVIERKLGCGIMNEYDVPGKIELMLKHNIPKDSQTIKTFKKLDAAIKYVNERGTKIKVYKFGERFIVEVYYCGIHEIVWNGDYVKEWNIVYGFSKPSATEVVNQFWKKCGKKLYLRCGSI